MSFWPKQLEVRPGNDEGERSTLVGGWGRQDKPEVLMRSSDTLSESHL